MLTKVICFFYTTGALRCRKVISWKHSFNRLNEEYEIARKKQQALDSLYEKGKISQATHDSFNGEIAAAIAEIEKQQQELIQKMQAKTADLQGQIKTLEILLANYEIQHVAGEIDENTYNLEINLLANGLETAKRELETIQSATNQLLSPPAPAPITQPVEIPTVRVTPEPVAPEPTPEPAEVTVAAAPAEVVPEIVAAPEPITQEPEPAPVPVAEAPAAPVVEEPAPVVEAPVVEAPVVEAAPVEETVEVVESAPVEEVAVVEAPVVEAAAPVEVVAPEPVAVAEPVATPEPVAVVEAPVVEAPVVEAAPVEETVEVVESAPVEEVAVVEAPVVEAPVVEVPVETVEVPVQDVAPAIEEPVIEQVVEVAVPEPISVVEPAPDEKRPLDEFEVTQPDVVQKELLQAVEEIAENPFQKAPLEAQDDLAKVAAEILNETQPTTLQAAKEPSRETYSSSENENESKQE
jgi:hypothetical protein